MFLLPEINLRLRPRILDLKPGTRIVSNSFDMGEWTADRTVEVSDGCTDYCTAYLWIVPAKAEGTWQLPQGEIHLKQEFQQLSGTLKSGNHAVPITNGRLRGDEISFMAGATHYTGRVSGDVMQGTFRSGGRDSQWKATRAGKR